MKTLLAIIFCLFIGHVVIGQSSVTNKRYPEIGKPCPDFMLKNVLYSTKNTAQLSDYKGQWLLLDFWGTGCSSCFSSFPKINALRKEFKGKAEFLLVGFDDKYIRSVYEPFRKKQHLDIPVVYDTLLFEQFGVKGIPHIVWIDEKGIVRAITSSSDVNAENIQAMISGETNEVLNLSNNDPLNVDTNFIFQSVLTYWKPGTGYEIPESIGDVASTGSLQLNGMNLHWMYRLAYTGAYYYSPLDSLYYQYALLPVAEVRDTTMFTDNTNGKNTFSYSLKVPKQKSSAAYLQQLMQKDLSRYFGYKVSIEKRILPCYSVTLTDVAKRKFSAKGGEAVNNSTHAGISVKNYSIPAFLYLIWKYHQSELLIDKTGLEKITIDLPALMTDFEDVRKELHKQGIDLVKGEKEMKVIVIRD